MSEKTSYYDISNEIWERKYRYKGQSDASTDMSIDDTWKRVASAVGEREKRKTYWTDKFLGILSDMKFLPGGRIIANAGTSRQEVTMFNCYVMNKIPDSIDGIFDTVKDSALTQKQGGGVGFDFSTLRPEGADIKGCEAESSGPISFMQVLDSTCRTIMSAGQRRGAQMGVMRCDHPDIEKFITAKRDNARLQMFNLSVAVTDKFIQAVKNNEPWELTFQGQVYKTVHAVQLWELIMKSTYDYAEPGFILIDRINEMNNLYYAEDIRATNPCVTFDTWVQTSEGPRQVEELLGKAFMARVNGKDWETTREGFFKTGEKKIFKITTREGFEIRLTENHPLKRVDTLTRYSLESSWAEAGELQIDDQIILHDHSANPIWQGAHNWDEGYLMGLLVGDGTLKRDKAVLSVWLPAAVENGDDCVYGECGVMEQALESSNKLPHRADFKGWMEVNGRNEWRLSLSAIKNLTQKLGMTPGNKSVTPEVERTSSDFYKGFLRGLFDADGSVQGSQKKGASVRLAQSNLDTLKAVQRMLLRLGIFSRIYQERRQAQFKLLPDGNNGTKPYHTQAQHELIISGEGLKAYQDLIGFSNFDKKIKLKTILESYKRSLNKTRFVATVESVEIDGFESVYDVSVPGVNAFDANGFMAHNCGEQPLPPYGACLLGSLNLTKFVKAPFTKGAKVEFSELAEVTKIATRLLDNVIDLSNYPLPQQRDEAFSKRRMGIGVTGLADLFIFMGVRYGSKESLALAEDIMRTVTHAAYETSVQLGKEKGVFKLFDGDQYASGKFIQTLPKDLVNAIRKKGLRNSHLTSIAPTGTISLLADNISSGLEPVFALKYTRKLRNTHENDTTEVEVADYAYRRYMERVSKSKTPPRKLPDYFVTTDDITPMEHVEVQAALQKYVDSSISKTINVPQDFPFDKFEDIYMKAYEKGLKGCTTFRPSDHIAGVLIKDEDKKDKLVVSDDTINIQKRPHELEGTTYKIKTPLSAEALYVTINDLIDENGRRPYELFINTKNLQHLSWMVAMTRLISAIFRRDPKPSFLVEELENIFDPNGGYFRKGKYIPSLVADIGKTIEIHLNKIGIMNNLNLEEELKEDHQVDTPKEPDSNSSKMFCPQCNERELVSQENCLKCLSCGYSKCG